MNRRVFLAQSTCGAAILLSGCGGSGSTSESAPITVVPAPPAPTPTPTPAPSPAPAPTPTPSSSIPFGVIGDSMIAGLTSEFEAMPYYLSQITGQLFNNLGVIAQTTPEIAARVGATPTYVSLTGDMIPSSGSVTLKKLTPFIVNHTGPTYYTPTPGTFIQLAIAGTLGGVHGYIKRKVGTSQINENVPIEDFSFTRSSDGAAVSVAPGSQFVTDNAAAYASSPLIIRMGYNNKFSFDQVVADHLAIIAWSKQTQKRILLLDPPISFYENDEGKAALQRIRVWLRDEAIRQGLTFYSLHDYVASEASLRDAGIIPTPSDLTAIAAGRTPMSATVGDGLHYAPVIHKACAAKLAGVLKSVGYIA